MTHVAMTCAHDLSPKQEIYCEMLRTGVVEIRNIQSRPLRRRFRDRVSYLEAELLHHHWHLLMHRDIREADLHFLRHQAARYLRDEASRKSMSYQNNRKCIGQLIDLVTVELQPQLRQLCGFA